jgi:hypothetical protein
MAHAEDVQVQFGASVAGLTAGINQVKEHGLSVQASVLTHHDMMRSV